MGHQAVYHPTCFVLLLTGSSRCSQPVNMKSFMVLKLWKRFVVVLYAHVYIYELCTCFALIALSS